MRSSFLLFQACVNSTIANYKLQTTNYKLQNGRYKLQTTITNLKQQITNYKSSGIDHNVDELLVGLVTQIHLRREARSKTCKVSTTKMMMLRTSMRIKMFTMLSTSIINDLRGVNNNDDKDEDDYNNVDGDVQRPARCRGLFLFLPLTQKVQKLSWSTTITPMTSIEEWVKNAIFQDLIRDWRPPPPWMNKKPFAWLNPSSLEFKPDRQF